MLALPFSTDIDPDTVTPAVETKAIGVCCAETACGDRNSRAAMIAAPAAQNLKTRIPSLQIQKLQL
jgi:hypothetical protein